MTMNLSKKAVRFRQGFAALLLCLLCVACPDGRGLPFLGKDAVILCFGDSLTFGTGAEETKSYPAVLAELTGRKVVNAGVPGEVSAEGLRRLPGVLDRARPQLMTLCLGVNDIRRGVDRRELKDNMREMLKLAKKRGVPVLLIAAPELRLTLTKEGTWDFIARTPPPLYAELSKKFGAPLEADILGRIINDPALKSDALHPNAAGYRKLAEAVVDILRENGAIR